MTFTLGTDKSWFNNKLIYTGNYISSVLEYNGNLYSSFKLYKKDG